MLVKRSPDLTYADVTPKDVYINRRKFLAGALAASGGALAWSKAPAYFRAPRASDNQPVKLNGVKKWPGSTSEPITSEEIVTHYNNFYEFGTDKTDPAKNATHFQTSPWSVSIEGEVKKPRKLTMDEIMKLAPLEERIYRHRCVEAWSIVVPWIGYSLSTLLNQVQPTSKAKFVAFQSLYDPAEMPQGKWAGIAFPYIEGLRLDEAMHPLTLLCVGMYGATLPNQDGAPVRLVIPWKYGFKSIKSIVKIRFVKDQPPTTWNNENSQEYGFYSNVNPNRDHPRWSQKTERRLGGGLFHPQIPTRMFNGYGDQVAHLYTGMDLIKYF